LEQLASKRKKNGVHKGGGSDGERKRMAGNANGRATPMSVERMLFGRIDSRAEFSIKSPQVFAMFLSGAYWEQRWDHREEQ
jgi:hypothetical protein